VHLFEGSLQRLCGRVYRVYRGMTGRLGGDSSALSRCAGRFPGFPQVLSLLPHYLERLTMLVADFARFLGQLSELLGLIPGSLAQLVLRRPVGFGLSGIVRHVVPCLAGLIVGLRGRRACSLLNMSAARLHAMLRA